LDLKKVLAKNVEAFSMRADEVKTALRRMSETHKELGAINSYLEGRLAQIKDQESRLVAAEARLVEQERRERELQGCFF
jgi:hypothetical protein